MQLQIGVVAGAMVVLSAPALALGQNDSDDDGDRVVLTNQGKRKVHREGEYGGVQPGVSGEGTRRCGKLNNRISWIGFQEQEAGASRLFVQMCGEMPYTQEVVGNKLVVVIEGAKYLTRNASRRLDTRYFDTSILQVTSKRQRRRRARRNREARVAGIRITISFKNAADAQQANASMSAAEDGYTYLFLDFGPGSDRDRGDDGGTSITDDDVGE